MSDLRSLQQLYREELGRGPFPTQECREAKITGKLQGELIAYLGNIAGLASRGDRLLRLSDSEKEKYSALATRSLFDKYPRLRSKLTATTTPKLYALVEATEKARLMIVEALAVSGR
jgi:hypothetical protein